VLEQVDVLELVDGESQVLGLEPFACVVVGGEHSDGQLEQIFEVDESALALAVLVRAIDTRHEVRGNRRFVPAERVLVVAGPDAAVLGPLDLRGQVGGGAEAIGLRKPVGDVSQCRALGRENAARRLGGEMAQLR
jgi:hypothetical protein